MGKKAKRVFITDCEGPITKNDNAAELADAFIPGGHVFFSKVSLYDDYLAEVVRKHGYKAGDTLRLILPFFKAFGVDNRTMIKFSRRNIQVVPEAARVLKNVLSMAPAYIVSTSYSQYIMAVCDAIGFPFLNTFSTAVNLDHYELKAGERRILKDIHDKILHLPDFVIPPGTTSTREMSPGDLETVRTLDGIFWEIIPQLEIRQLIHDVNPVGGSEKAIAVGKIIESEEVGLEDVFYVGDSITDVEAFRMVKEAGGFALSFNGNDWAVRHAGFAVTSNNALPIGWLAELFLRFGNDTFTDLSMGEVTAQNEAAISELSCRVRKMVRTERIGGLG